MQEVNLGSKVGIRQPLLEFSHSQALLGLSCLIELEEKFEPRKISARTSPVCVFHEHPNYRALSGMHTCRAPQKALRTAQYILGP